MYLTTVFRVMVSTVVDIFSIMKPAKAEGYRQVSSSRIFKISEMPYTVSSKTGAKFNQSIFLMLPPFFHNPNLFLRLQACLHHYHQIPWLRTSPCSFHHRYHHIFVLFQSLRKSATLNFDYADPKPMMLLPTSDVSAA